MKQNHSAILRIWKACGYSKDGLLAAVAGEAAFRQELLLFLVTLPVIYLLPLALTAKLLLIGAHFLVLITELVNSAIEAVIDLVSPEFNQLAKKAKDMGSAAVFLSLLLTGCLWIVLLFSLY